MSNEKAKTQRVKIQANLSAVKLRLLLFVALLLLLATQAGITLLGQRMFTAYSQQVAEVVAESSSNDKTLQALETAQSRLNEQKETVDKASQLVAPKGEDYQYQSRVVEDLSRYAEAAGIKIANYSFSDAAATTTGTAAAKPATGTTTPTAFKQPTGVTPVSISISFAEGTTYETTYKFLQLLEGGLLFMQPESITLSAAVEGDESASGVSSLNLRIYKKS